MRTTVGQILINDALPEDMRDHDRVLDKKGVKKLFQDLAENHPDKYREVSHALSKIGHRAAQETGGFSFGLANLRKSKAGKAVRKRILAAMETVLADDKITDDERDELITKLTGREMEGQKKAIYEEALAEENPLAMQVMSGSRGNPMNLSSLLGSDLLYTDQRDRLIPVPVLRSSPKVYPQPSTGLGRTALGAVSWQPSSLRATLDSWPSSSTRWRTP